MALAGAVRYSRGGTSDLMVFVGWSSFYWLLSASDGDIAEEAKIVFTPSVDVLVDHMLAAWELVLRLICGPILKQ